MYFVDDSEEILTIVATYEYEDGANVKTSVDYSRLNDDQINYNYAEHIFDEAGNRISEINYYKYGGYGVFEFDGNGNATYTYYEAENGVA